VTGADTILLSDPDMSQAEIDAVSAVIASPHLSAGRVIDSFEQAFAAYVGRGHAVAVASGTIGLLLCLSAYGIGAGDEVIASSYSWHQIAHAIALAGAKPVFSEIDYWTGSLAAEKAVEKITPRTRAILAANTNGHPAQWGPLRAIAEGRGLLLLEDSTEAIGSAYQGILVGGFGDCAIFDFSQPGPLVCGEGAMIVTDDDKLASSLRRLRARRADEVISSAAAHPPMQAGMSNLAAALGLTQLQRIESILARRKQVEEWYGLAMQSFEGIKPPYLAPEVTDHHWFMYVVHLGTRFSRSSRDAILDDMRTEQVEAKPFCIPLHTQTFYAGEGYRRGAFFVTEKVADRAIALPFHGHLRPEQVAFIVKSAKEASINVGAGSAIYL
jgi:perosamine synthetase